jgi:hypothetical protein
MKTISLTIFLFYSACKLNAQNVTVHIANVLALQDTNCLVLRTGSSGEDAWVYDHPGFEYANFGSDIQLPALAWTFNSQPATVRSLVNFDLSSIPVTAIISSAALSLYAWNNSSGFGFHSILSGPNDCMLEKITDPWTEALVNWNNQPSTTPVSSGYLASSTSPSQNYINVDVTALLQSIVSDTARYGFMIRLVDENYYRSLNFCSGENPDSLLHPQLEICYTVPVNVNDQYHTSQIMLFPNPVEDELNIINGGVIGELKNCSVIALTGEIIRQFNFNSKNGKLSFAGITPGTYILRIYNDRHEFNSVVVKK